MKDIFSKKSQNSFFEVLQYFVESLEEMFPADLEVKEWALWFRNVVVDNEKKRQEGVAKWVECMQTPLSKGSARYAKAVQSILGSPATVYHAIAYHDAHAADASSLMLQPLCLCEKLQDDAMDEMQAKLFWEYMESMNEHAFAAMRISPPTVPTPEQISEDILKRKDKSGAASSSTGEPVLRVGMKDLWVQLCATCNEEALTTTACPEIVASAAWAQRCKERDLSAWNDLKLSLPPGQTTPTDAQWEVLDRMIAFQVMDSSIPSNMMHGIESMASRLVQDMQSGKADMSSLNMETIGEQVLANVSQEEIASFANNMDKLLPALQKMNGMGPKGPFPTL
jgi:hypothetical protein